VSGSDRALDAVLVYLAQSANPRVRRAVREMQRRVAAREAWAQTPAGRAAIEADRAAAERAAQVAAERAERAAAERAKRAAEDDAARAVLEATLAERVAQAAADDAAWVARGRPRTARK